ncbi:MAG: HupE/UreJ family protein, partial [Candidatus Dadabacteria bacterium]
MLGIALLAGVPSPSSGHPLSPSLLELVELEGGGVRATWIAPASRPVGRATVPFVDPPCTGQSRPAVEVEGARIVSHQLLDCGSSGLEGRRIGVSGLAEAKTTAIVRIELADGRRLERLVDGAAPAVLVPRAPSAWTAAADYVELGVHHIASGRDHLLFVLALVLITILQGPAGACSRRQRLARLTAAVSAFTAGHSVTLSAAVLGWVNFPARPIEAGIALSIVLLAAELARGSTGESLLSRRPWAAAFAFGLLHGFGFAGALSAAGLPNEAIPLALASFNAGIELGQLLFVAAVVSALALAWRAAPAAAGRKPAIARSCGYAIGIVAARWTLER